MSPRRWLWVALCVVVVPATAAGQAVPEGSQAAAVPMGYRRTPRFGVDPFRHVMIPHWGFVFTSGGTGGNNALNLEDIGALSLLSSDDDIRVGDLIDVLTLIPEGQGLAGAGQFEAGGYLGMSLGQRFMLGVSAGTRAYGTFELDDAGVALLRDGNAARQDFTLGRSKAAFLTTAELGVHSVMRTGPLGSQDAVQLAIGVGARYLRPAAFIGVRSLIDNGGAIRATGDSISVNLGIEVLSSIPLGDGSGSSVIGDAFDRARGAFGGSATVVGDLLLRAEWPTSGFSVEGVLLNLGPSVKVPQVSRRADTLAVQTSSLDSLRESVDAFDLAVRDSVDASVSLPRIWRLGASAWANRILQLDLNATGSFAGDIDMPLTVDLVTSWRFLRHLPLRAGVVLGGRQGIGYSGGMAIESRNFLFQVSGETLGGWFRTATGVGGRLDFGFFF